MTGFKVSIVTISYNQVEFLERTIGSVLGQNYPNLEYILVDPGSTDGSRELIKRYREKLAHVVFEADAGPSDGLNKGFSLATGDILGFLNSDDILYPGSISSAARFFQEHPGVDVVSGHAKIIGPDDRVLRNAYSDPMSIKRSLYSAAFLIQPSTFFRRSAFVQVGGFNVNNRVTWDGELFFDMARAGCRFARSKKIWSGYRLHSASITTSWNPDEHRKRDEVIHRRFQQVLGREPNQWDKVITRAYQICRRVLNPRDTVERLFRGPIFRRKI